MAHSGTNWRPTQRQSRLLEAAQDEGLDRSISVVCKAAGVPRRTAYNWLKDPDFAAAWNDVWYGTIRRHLPGAIAALVQQAQEGDVSAIKLVCELAGVYSRRTQVGGDHGGQPVVVQFVRPEEGI